MLQLQQSNHKTVTSDDQLLIAALSSLGYVGMVTDSLETLRILCEPPAWWCEVFGTENADTLSSPTDVPIFDVFVEQCEEFWASESDEDPWLISDIWEQPTASAPTLHLQGLATTIDHKPLLLLKRLDLATDGRIESIRAVRETMLAGEDHAALKDQLNLELMRAKEAAEQFAKEKTSTQAKVRGVFDNSSNFMGLLAVDGKLTEINITALNIAGVDRDDVIGCPFWEAAWWSHSRSLQAKVKQAVLRSTAGESIRLEVTTVDQSNAAVLLDLSIKPIFDENGVLLHLMPEARDITETKANEIQLRNLMQRLEESNRDLEQFASIASHDLQEPLRKITGYGELLEDEFEGNLDGDAKKYLDIMTDGARRMKQLIQDMLAFSKVASGETKPEVIDANASLEAAVSDLQMMIEESSAHVAVNSLPMVLTEAAQLKAIFQNLISNAIKYRSSEAPRITIGCEDRGSAYEFFVQDNGLGIEEKHFAQVFEIFQRLHNGNGSDSSGTGIGLAICKRIVERLGGRFRIESELGVGSTFFFTLPKVPDRERCERH